jgi:hypothetical protein
MEIQAAIAIKHPKNSLSNHTLQSNASLLGHEPNHFRQNNELAGR